VLDVHIVGGGDSVIIERLYTLWLLLGAR